MQAHNLECNTLIKANTYRQIIKVQMRKRVQQGTETDSVLLLSFQTILNKISLKWVYPTLSSQCHLWNLHVWKQEIKGPHPYQWEQNLKLEITRSSKSPKFCINILHLEQSCPWSSTFFWCRYISKQQKSPIFCPINMRNLAFFSDTRPKKQQTNKKRQPINICRVCHTFKNWIP